MPSLVELKYNPYLPNLSILIEGKQLPDFSKLVQYLDEDLWKWYWEILDTVYSEIRNDFMISFTGTSQDAQIMEAVCLRHKMCRGFRAKEFVISETLQMRMKKLNQYIKNLDGPSYIKTVIDAVFLIPTQMQGYLEDISSLDVNNLFCTVRVSTMELRSDYKETDTSFLFLITNQEELGIERLHQLKIKKPAFVLVIGNHNGIVKVTEHAWYFGTTPNNLFNAIFSCLLQVPLLIAFRRCIKSISQKTDSSKFHKIYATDPIINIRIPDKIEVGKSTKIPMEFDPPVSEKPDLVYNVINQTVASCDGLCILGRQEGAATLEVYRQGDKKPFFVKEIQVIKRNRITSIVLSENTLLMGISDRKRIGCDYFPRDADNVRSIVWKSSDQNVIRVDSNGTLTAVGKGNCRIICTAENISAQCICTVKPYLKDVSFEFNLNEDVMRLEPMEEFALKIQTHPDDCVDGSLSVRSSDNSVVNVIKSTLYAKSNGEAMITVENSNGTISRKFKVIVTKKKAGFFAKLFK